METVGKALDILEVFFKHDGEIGITELANLSGVNISTAHRITSLLVKKKYLSHRQKRGKYSIGFKFLEFSGTVKRRVKVRDVALPFMKEINAMVGESVNLAILDSDEAVYIEQVESSKSLRIFTEVGNRAPLYCTGVGKIFLAYMADEEKNRILHDKGLYPLTENTTTDIDTMNNVLIKIKHDGYALDDGEMEQGVRCVASPVRDWNGNVVAAVSVSGPSARLSNERLGELIPLVKNSGLEISRAMAYTGE
ncbi:IclR family transcriptional regulator [Chloroflexota bacterium]